MANVNHDNFAVIMAGGIGSRFWPMSRTNNPKQFHDILGVGRTLIQMTYDRLRLLVPAENIFVVTNRQYRERVLEQLGDLSSAQVLCEPFMRNTAPCIAYANFVIQNRNPNARIVVAPADHLITNETLFIETVQLAIDETAGTNNLVTLGIEPSRPDTGYGYIQFEEDLHVDSEALGVFGKEALGKIATFCSSHSVAKILEVCERHQFSFVCDRAHCCRFSGQWDRFFKLP